MPEFICPQTILTGPGCFDQLPKLAAPIGKRAILVIGRGHAVSDDLLAKTQKSLADAGLSITVFRGVLPEPPCEQVDELRNAIRANDIDLVIGLGGGSALDVAKAAAILCFSDRPTLEHVDSGQLPDRSLPMLAVPTTAGTGTEATPTSVLTDTTTAIKKSIRHPKLMMPAVAIVDPNLMLSCPPTTTAAAGLDALTQAIESFCSILATDLTDALAEKALKLIINNLETAWRDGSNLSARQAMAEGSLLAGMALTNARLGIVHGLGHPIGGTCHLPHGQVCATLLPVALEYNKQTLCSSSANKYARLTDLLGGDPIDVTRRLLTVFDLPRNFRDHTLTPAQVTALAAQSLTSGSTKANPRKATQADMEAMLCDLFHIA